MTSKQSIVLAASIASVILGLLITTTEGTLATIIGFGAMWVGGTCAFGVFETDAA